MCDQLAEQQRDGLTGRQEQATGPLRMPSWPALRGKVVAFRRRERVPCWSRSSKLEIWVCTSLPTTPHLVVGRSACRVGVGPSLNRSWAQRSRPVVQAGRRAFPGDESVVD